MQMVTDGLLDLPDLPELTVFVDYRFTRTFCVCPNLLG